MKKTSKSLEINGKTITFSTGELAQQASASVLGRLGDTMILATVVVGGETSLDYFPLNVEYIERLYAGGRIKGSRWVKREGRPTDEAILTARLIDRSIRPLFPKDFKNEVQVIVTVLSVDGECDPATLSINAVSAALAISKIPWAGPIAASKVGLVGKENGENELVINPSVSEEEFLYLDMVVSSTAAKVHMLEAGAKQVSEDLVKRAVQFARSENKKIIDLINEMVSEAGEKKMTVVSNEAMLALVALIQKGYKDDIKKLIEEDIDKEVGNSLSELALRIVELESKNADAPFDLKLVERAVDYVFKRTIREQILERGQRPDKRKVDEIRPLNIKVGILPRTHGSAIFQRGETQALSVATLGTPSLEQLIESAEGEESKRYMHHYSFPPFSTGETGRVGSPSRREIGHGALAERALEAVLPPPGQFPYAIRVVSEILSSNGSTSMASTCGSSLALMDAGVPIQAHVAGIAMGLMSSDEKYVVLTDIMGLEDFSGDMDFKVAGTATGITAIQLDVKIEGLTDEMISETLDRARDARLFILEKMLEVMPTPRKSVSQFAPKIKEIKIDTDKIGEVIGSGGRIIKNIIGTTGATVDVEDDGTVTISSLDPEAVDKAVYWVELLARELKAGEVFEGVVKRLLPFGAFVEIVPGKEGLVHVSEMSTEYVKDPADVVQLGQKVKVRVKEVDEQGRLNLSMVFGERNVESEYGGGRRREGGVAPSYRRDDRSMRRGAPSDNFPGMRSRRNRSERTDRGPRRRHH